MNEIGKANWVVAGLLIASLSTIAYVADTQAKLKYKEARSSKEQFYFIKDPETKCQYIVSNGAMYPRLDDKRRHICSDELKYYFKPEA